MVFPVSALRSVAAEHPASMSSSAASTANRRRIGVSSRGARAQGALRARREQVARGQLVGLPPEGQGVVPPVAGRLQAREERPEVDGPLARPEVDLVLAGVVGE